MIERRASSKGPSAKALLGLAFIVIAVVLAAPSAAAAARIVVDSTATPPEPNECVLRDAIMAANKNQEEGGCAAGSATATDVIEFELPPETTITIAGSALEPIEESTDIRGPGPADLTVDGNRSVRVFDVEEGEVEISGMRISDGSCTLGCGITNEHLATLVLEDVLVKRNVAEPPAATDPAITGGAGILNEGTLTMTLSTVTENEATAKTGIFNAVEGAGIKNFGDLTIDRSTIAGNAALADREAGGESAIAAGAGIANDGGRLTIERSAIVENHAHASFADQENRAEGAGIAAAAGEVTIRDSTIAENVALATAPSSPTTAVAQSTGGAIQVGGTGFAIANSTIARNSAEEGANLYLELAPTLASTIVAAPEGGGEDCEGGSVGSVVSAGFNLESEDSCGFDQPTDHVEINPLLAAGLADNGGPTETVALRPGSPALDQGKSAAGETTDQRGLTRPVDIAGLPNAAGGDGTDIGAFEFQVPLARITTGPAAGETLGAGSATFAFDADEPAAGFECSLDGAPATSCTSPDTLSGLANGAHTFGVVAVDDNGYAIATPTARSFTVAVKEPPPAPAPVPPTPHGEAPPPIPPPRTTIRGLPAKTFDRTPAIRFGSNQAGSTFRCKLDDGPWKPCTSPYRPKKLAYGTHTFRVVATNPAGEADPSIAKRTFRVLRR